MSAVRLDKRSIQMLYQPSTRTHPRGHFQIFFRKAASTLESSIVQGDRLM